MEASLGLLFVAVFLVIILLRLYFDRKRTKTIEALAEAWGFEFVAMRLKTGNCFYQKL